MAPRPSYAQLEALVEFLEQNPGIAKGLLRTSSAKAETKRKWATLATLINALGGPEKDGIGWAKYWSEKKCALKKHTAEYNASKNRTGGGPAEFVSPLSSLDHRMIALMGGPSFAIGDIGLAPDPFPNLNVIIVPEDTQDREAHLPESLCVADLAITLPTSPAIHTDAEEREGSPHQSVPPPLQAQRTERTRTRRIRQVNLNSVEQEMDRLVNIESRRVEAELITAQAFQQLSASMDRIAVAQENMATSFSSQASALLQLAKRLPEQ